VSVHWPIIRRLALNPRRVLVVDDRRSYTGAELLVGSMHIAAAIKPKSDTRGVGILLPSCGAFPMVALASWMLGRTVVPLNFLLKPEELQYVIDNAGIDTVVTAQAMLDHLGHRPRVRHLLRLDDVSFTGVPEPVMPSCPADDDLAVLLYTSGTSGKPKGVMLTHGNLAANIRQTLGVVPVQPDDVMLGVLPQFHSFGLTVLTLLPLTVGIKAVFTAKFVPGRLVRLMREHHATFFVAIASMWGALLNTKEATPEDFASLRYAISGGEPLPDAVASRFKERFGVVISEGYGLTETSPVTNVCLSTDHRLHSVGRPVPWLEQRIVDPATGRPVETGHDGEVQMKGPNVTQGYFRLPAETAAAFTHDGYFRTGDIGRFDDDGFLYITGRLKEMLIIGGENVFPREIEEVLGQHPAVAACGVIGCPDPIRGEVPVAFVEVREGIAAGESDLIAWCRGRLAGYKVPRDIRVVAELPKNPTGKVVRRELRKWL
jgi:long-chain acyl-CoA synthetase